MSPHHSSLITHHSARGFTLIEMMVAIAILLAVMGMVGVIFNTASRSSGLAQQMSAVHRDQRAVGSVIRADLQACQTGGDGSSHQILAIAGVEVVAHSNAKDAESNRPLVVPADLHRADVLMFTTDRDIQPYVFRQLPPPSTIELDRTVMVTYSHADTFELVQGANPGSWVFPATNGTPAPRRIESTTKPLIGALPLRYSQSDLPSHMWHLTRRVLRFPARTLAGPAPGVAPAATGSIVDPAILQGRYDVYPDPYNDPNDPRSILPQMGQGYFQYDSVNPRNTYHAVRGSAGGRYWWYRLENLTANASGQPSWFVFANDVWFGSPATNAATCGSWQEWVRQQAGVTPDPATCAPDPAASLPNGLGLDDLDRRLAFYDPNQRDRRTILDPNPPAGAGDAMGAYFLPNCSDFLVEYTYDDPAELLLAPDASGNTWRAEPQAPIRWQRVPNGQQRVWSRLSVNPKNYSDPLDPRNRTDPIRWPRALRITLRSYGPGTTLEDPVEQVIIHTFQ